MVYIDIAFLILFAAIMIRGLFRGFVKEAISLVGLFAAYFAGIYALSNINSPYYRYCVRFLHNDEAGRIVVFSAAFIAVLIVFAIISILMTKILNLLQLGFCNRVAGFFLPASRLLFF